MLAKSENKFSQNTKTKISVSTLVSEATGMLLQHSSHIGIGGIGVTSVTSFKRVETELFIKRTVMYLITNYIKHR